MILCGCGFLPFSGSGPLWLWHLAVQRQLFSVAVTFDVLRKLFSAPVVYERSKAVILCGVASDCS